MKRVRRICVFIMIMTLVMSLTGCGKNGALVYTLNGEKVYRRQVDAYGLIYVFDHGINGDTKFEEYYEGFESYSEHYKNALENEIVTTVLLNKEAKNNGNKISSEQVTEAGKKAKALVDLYGEDRLKEYNLTLADIENIYEMIIFADEYAVESDEDKKEEKEEASDEDDRYVSVYQVTFPTVAFDDQGMVQSDSEGKLIQVSVDEMNKMKEAADAFAEKATSGDIEKLADAEGNGVTGANKTLKYSDLTGEYKDVVDGLSENRVSKAFKGEYGYYVIKLLIKDDEDHSNLISKYEEQKKLAEDKKELSDKLLRKYVGDDKNYRKDKEWDTVKIENYIP
ncbi:MAG: peptidyl-prolyl cis-trans isomerase [Lachnospiraceae bacterium]|nr:peptidyl-prolyl cis-trans isomerase [Lachnospiraceae bacterium]